jgi:hypothetical protein
MTMSADGCDQGRVAAWRDVGQAEPEFAAAGGGKWEAMHGAMGGWHEIRLTGPGREQFRLFCLLENAPARS